LGGFTIECDGEFIEMPFDGNWMVSTLEGRFPNSVMLRIDETRFKLGFEKHCVSTVYGKGRYATLGYCGHGLTVR
jgi:hypothetical protein